MRKFKCKCCEQILEIEENQDEIVCSNCHIFYRKIWHIGLKYKELSMKQKIIMIHKVWDLYGGVFRLGKKYAFISSHNKLAYKIDIDTGIFVGGHHAPGSVEDELFEALNEEEEIKEVCHT